MQILGRLSKDKDAVHKKYVDTENNTLHATINEEKVDWDDTAEWTISEIADIWVKTFSDTTEESNGN